MIVKAITSMYRHALGFLYALLYSIYFAGYCLYSLAYSLASLVWHPVGGRYAARSLFRNIRRTILSVIGVGIGSGIGLFATSWISGGREMQIRAASESGCGHLRVVPAKWPDLRENTLRLADWRRALAAIEETPAVRKETISLRARSNCLLAMGNRTAGVEIVGVTPDAETVSNRIVYRSRVEGRYLRAGDARRVVIGKKLAKKLSVELDDDLYLTLSGREEITSDLLTIVGILETGSTEIDSVICHVTLADMERISGYEGPGEIAVMLDDHKLIDATREDLAARIGEGDTVITWMEVNREIAANMEGDTAFTRILIAIIVIVVSLGIMSAQLTAVLERRREFGVLTALGMKGRQIVGLITTEAVIVGLGGAVVGLALGGPFAYWLAVSGVDLGKMLGGELGFAGVLFDPKIFTDFGWWVVWYALGVSLMATFAASIYPAWFAVKTRPAEALRVV